eukprot:TRINITY_DN4520_c0_g1_i2.p1 TRINITY_DN4520_c0_g1~~TRINITY_DN4520_c0_g1_i2.p1  ORF type:complete len:248 (-),score=72.68 TRINITY_DN4520_c0_g1_i2:298-1041(-)
MSSNLNEEIQNNRRLLLISNSTNHGEEYLAHCMEAMKEFLAASDVKQLAFVPYALKDMDAYTKAATDALEAGAGVKVVGVHAYEGGAVKAVEDSDAIFIGGGNTFRLLTKLYENGLVEAIRSAVAQGKPYMGTSAGTNVSALSIRTTNDMPIMYPPSFDALQLVPFQINPHFIDANPNSTHMGETREKRLKEFHEENDSTVIGIREGAILHVEGGKMTLEGINGGVVFTKDAPGEKVEVEGDLSEWL